MPWFDSKAEIWILILIVLLFVYILWLDPKR